MASNDTLGIDSTVIAAGDGTVDESDIKEGSNASAAVMPATIEELLDSLDREGFTLEALKEFLQDPKYERLSYPVRQIIKYQIPSLMIGRPLDTVMIVMAGETGTGKSSTINRLFDKLCETDPEIAKTRKVTECTKYLDINEGIFPLKAYLSLVDFPGIPHDNKDEEEGNMTAILQFRRKYKKFNIGHVRETRFSELIRGVVFPNLVLLTFIANNTRVMGKDTSFKESLRALKETNLLDMQYTNLIVIATHAMALNGRTTEIYKRRTSEITQRVNRAVQEILNFNAVRVVYIENDEDSFLEDKKGDFYSLPDGELSHRNLFQAMRDVFTANNDGLGLLLISWYFQEDIQEKKVKSEIKVVDFQDDSEFPTSLENSNSLNLDSLCFDSLHIEHQQYSSGVFNYNFLYFGYGYCPVVEKVKFSRVFKSEKKKVVEIMTQKYGFPRGANVGVKIRNKANIDKVSFKTKQEYLEHRMTIYSGFEMELQVDSSVEFIGKWEDEPTALIDITFVAFSAEFSMAEVTLEVLDDDNIAHQLKVDIDSLPDIYCSNTVDEFYNFFDKWGSHCVTDVNIGGSITILFKGVKAKLEKIDKNILRNYLLKRFSSFDVYFDNQSDVKHFDVSPVDENNIRTNIIESEIVFIGGCPPSIRHLDDLKPMLFKNWFQSIQMNPVDLENTIKLKPYYSQVMPMEKREEFRKATAEYLNSELVKKVSIKRSTVALSGLYQAASPNFEGSTYIYLRRIWEEATSFRRADSPCIIM